MTRAMRFSNWPAALLLLVACAPQSDFSSVSTAPITMVCDGGRTFTIAYANNFDTALVETEGQRLELARVRTASSMTPTPRGVGSVSSAAPFDANEGRGIGGRDDFGPQRGGLGVSRNHWRAFRQRGSALHQSKPGSGAPGRRRHLQQLSGGAHLISRRLPKMGVPP